MMLGGRSGMNSPTFILEQKKLQENLAHFEYLAKETSIIWLYTLKAFDAPEGLALIAHSFDGFSLGNANEYAKVKEYGKKVHSYTPAYYEEEVETLAKQSNTMSFNSLTQYRRYAKRCQEHTSLGLRINPKLMLNQPDYCNSNRSRLGVPYQNFLDVYQEDKEVFERLEGLHFHAFCYQDSHAFEDLITHIEDNYTAILKRLKWLNFGGGLDFTSKTFDTVHFMKVLQTFQQKYPQLTLYFEPASAVLKDVGQLEATVMDIISDTIPIVILNISIESHLLDIAIAHVQPTIKGASRFKSDYPYQITGLSCIAGDVIGSYYFNEKLSLGDTIYFEDMLAYTWVKQTSFNGLRKATLSVL